MNVVIKQKIMDAVNFIMEAANIYVGKIEVSTFMIGAVINSAG